MKTNIFSPRKTTFYFLVGSLSILVASCGSYQNSSYYDTDGIYGNTDNRTVATTTQSNQYKDYFNSLQNGNEPTAVFTDVESYGSYSNQSSEAVTNTNSGYASWGSNPQTTAIYVYPSWNTSFGFGMGYGFGMNYSWGYPNYGWGYPYYGWGYPNYGGGYYPGHNYYNNTSYSYSQSRRGSSYGNRATTDRYYSNGNSTSRVNSQMVTNRGTNSTEYRRSSGNNSLARTSPTFTNRGETQREGNTTRTREYNGNTREYSNGNSSRNQNNNSVRSYAPNTNSSRSENYSTPSRSSYTPSSGGNYSGGRSSGGGGGGRTSGTSGGRR